MATRTKCDVCGLPVYGKSNGVRLCRIHLMYTDHELHTTWVRHLIKNKGFLDKGWTLDLIARAWDMTTDQVMSIKTKPIQYNDWVEVERKRQADKAKAVQLTLENAKANRRNKGGR